MDITKSILFQKHIDAGMVLTEDDHLVTLSVKDAPIATWSATSDGVTTDEIRRAADLALGFSFEKHP